jgi:hypothetical protein
MIHPTRRCPNTSYLAGISKLLFAVPSVGRGHVVAHLVQAPRYKPEGRGFDSRRCHWDFCIDLNASGVMALGSIPASNRYEKQGCLLGRTGGRCAGLTTLPRSCADCVKVLSF